MSVMAGCGCLTVILLANVFTLVTSLDRVYYIAAVEIEWNYAPRGNVANTDLQASDIYLKNGPDRIGSIYKRAMFKQFTGPTFTEEIQQHESRGILGPEIKGEVGDTIFIYFKNLASRNYSVHPHGVRYIKIFEGAYYVSNRPAGQTSGDHVLPGHQYVYVWRINDLFSPGKDDPNCLVWAYHSHITSDKDITTGLIGTVVTCKKGILTPDGRRRDIDREYTLYFTISDESLNWHYMENIQKCGSPELCIAADSAEDRAFKESNKMYSINGYVFGNLPGLEVREGEKVAWYMIGMGSAADIHSVFFYGQTMVYNQHRVDTVSIFAAIFKTAEMVPMNPGRWMLTCRLNEHYKAGMIAFFNVSQRVRPYPIHPNEIQINSHRTYYIAAEEELWNYIPFGVDFRNATNLEAVRSYTNIIYNSNNSLSQTYKKAVFHGYTDASFTSRQPVTSSSVHLGMLGPVIRAEVNDVIEVVMKNMASRDYSFLPHGLAFSKMNEGAVYPTSFAMDDFSGAIVRPGETKVYHFWVPPVNGPTDADPDCVTYMYQSAVDPVRDTNSGLIGPLLVCKQGSLNSNGKQKNVQAEFIVMLTKIDENLSWYIDDNIKLRKGRPQLIDISDPLYSLSNLKSNINGYSFGNHVGFEMCQGQKVSWHIFGMGSTQDVHIIHFEGNTLLDPVNRVDSVSIFPGTSTTLLMTPDNLGHWFMSCSNYKEYNRGMFASYGIHACTPAKDIAPLVMSGTVRRYYIGAIEVDWEFCPDKISIITEEDLTLEHVSGHLFVRDDDYFIGSNYKKAIYREFTDDTFSEMKPRTPDEMHMGIIGPMIKAEVGDTIEIVFKNMASVDYSMHPHGVFYTIAHDNYYFNDNISDLLLRSRIVRSSQTFFYKWAVPDRSGPASDDPNCINWMYYSDNSPGKDTNSGMSGPIVICRRGTLNPDGRRKDVDRELVLLFQIFNETNSWYFQENVKNHAPARTNLRDPKFLDSNDMHSINGFVFTRNKGLTMYMHDRVAWYVYGLGQTTDIHTVHFHAELYVEKTTGAHEGDVLEIFPGISKTVEMVTNNPGEWLLHCHVNHHMVAGMETTYQILAEVRPTGGK